MADQEPNQFRVNVDKHTYGSLPSQHGPPTNRPEYSFAFSLSFNAITILICVKAQLPRRPPLTYDPQICPLG